MCFNTLSMVQSQSWGTEFKKNQLYAYVEMCKAKFRRDSILYK